MTQPLQPRRSERAHRRRSRPRGPRRALLLLVAVAVFAIGTAFGLALDKGSGAKGTQTCERTLRLVTVTVTTP